MKETQKDRALSGLPDGQGEAVMRLVDSLTCLICDELDKYDVRTGLGIGIMSIVLAKMTGVSVASAGMGLDELKESMAALIDDILRNTNKFYEITLKEMDANPKP